MPFIADLHVHSRHARSTSRDLDLEHMASEAMRKGIDVLGTGDAVHPAWLAELGEKLERDADGLYRLRPALAAAVARDVPPACRRVVRFVPQVEISTIYKHDGRTRKIHHLVLMPDLEGMGRFAARLGGVGNIASDGRPILGLPSRTLLAMALEADPGALLVPAHVWTPWFSVLGAHGGYDSVEACYGDLAPHIHALETGLSADPAMMRRVSALDRFRLVSSSDAHSPAKLGREATRFAGTPGWETLRRAVATGEGLAGTIEFFPDEGKYHLDGHRACGVRLAPAETRATEGRCPVCTRPVTVGVAHRVEVLADRDAPRPAAFDGPAQALVPLASLLAELRGVGVSTLGVARAREAILAALGPELPLLAALPLEAIAATDTLLAEAIRRLRAGETRREAGYDGLYGRLRMFAPGELRASAASPTRRARGDARATPGAISTCGAARTGSGAARRTRSGSLP